MSVPLIPYPRRVRWRSGQALLRPGAVLTVDPACAQEPDVLRQVADALALRGPEVGGSTGDGGVRVARWTAGAPMGAEGYRLLVSPDDIRIEAHTPVGALWAARTLVQLLPERFERHPRSASSWSVPCVEIADQPAFAWRGLMLDCSRTFLSLDYLRRTIDTLSKYKMNTLHLHLTDDQGWRFESRKWPRLTETGARWEPEYADVSGFYSQDQLRDLVSYAQARGVQLVPELEMPGHALGALKAYPELSCTGGPFRIQPYMLGPRIHYDVMCPGNPNTLRLCADVLAEAARIFPSPFLHVGGDEVPKGNWDRCPKCLELRRTEGLADGVAQQAWFTRQTERMVHRLGRRLIGWDEITEGGLPQRAAVMSWRSVSYGLEAIQKGHDVVFCPTSHCYFDYPYGVTPTTKVYQFDPAPADVGSSERQHILGVQACMWTHIARTDADIDRMIYPRLLALADVGWRHARGVGLDAFQRRLPAHIRRLHAAGVATYELNPRRAVVRRRMVLDLPLTGQPEAPGLTDWKPHGDAGVTADGLRLSGGWVNARDTGGVLGGWSGPFAVALQIRHAGQPERPFGSTCFSVGSPGAGGWRIGLDHHGAVMFTFYGVSDLVLASAVAPGDDRWHGVAVQFDGRDQVRIWVDGELRGELSFPSAAWPEGEVPVVIGSDPGGHTPYVGSVRFIRVWTGVWSSADMSRRSMTEGDVP